MKTLFTLVALGAETSHYVRRKGEKMNVFLKTWKKLIGVRRHAAGVFGRLKYRKNIILWLLLRG